MEGASFMSSRSIGYRPAPNDSVVGMPSNNNQKSLTPILDRFKVLLKEREEEIRVSNGGDDDIEIPLLSTEEIVELYEVVLSELVINSKPIITDLTIIAGEQREHGSGIADAICARIIKVHEGRNHEVRELVKSAGLQIYSLKRIRIGAFRLPPDLLFGKHIELKPAQLKALGWEEK